ncbi:hypothetical protein [Streptomyces sp. NPDC052721]
MTAELLGQLCEMVRAFERHHGFGERQTVEVAALCGVADVLMPGR